MRELDTVARDGLGKILKRQSDLITRRQLIACGVDETTVCRKVSRGEWQRALPAVYAMTAAPLSGEQRRVAAALYAGSTAQLTGQAALHWYGFRQVPATDRVHVLLPHKTRRRSTGFVMVQRTHELDPAVRDADLYRVTSPARAVIDACRANSHLRTVRAIMAEAVQRQMASLAALEDQIRRAGRSRTALARRVMRELVDGVRSSAEADLRDLVGTSAVLPRVLWNPRLVAPDGERLPTPDGWIPDASLALEVDSRTHHAGDPDWARTLRRHNELARFDIQVLHFTPLEIREQPQKVLREIEQAYVNRRNSNVILPVQEGAPY